MEKKSLLYNLLILNLFLIFILLLSKTAIIITFLRKASKVIILPIVISLFLYYLINPLKRLLVKKGLSLKLSVFLSLIISSLILYTFFFIIISNLVAQKDYFIYRVSLLITQYKDGNFNYIKDQLSNYIDFNAIKDYFMSQGQNYVSRIISILRALFDFGWNLFSNVILVLLIVYHLLKGDTKFKKYLLSLPFVRKHKRANYIIEEGDTVLSKYITGQATVAFFLALSVFLGYLAIGFPGKLFLSLLTFILAFIPFLGFFISMIIPYIIALTMGLPMVIKLTLVFMIAQTIKGRFIVPLVMSKAMKIHPLTDIFLVIAAATIFGIAGAFLVVPVYSILKIVWSSRNIELQ